MGFVNFWKVQRVRDIKVLELEKDVLLGGDTKKYLPVDFIPVQGIEFSDQQKHEEDLMFAKVFGDRNEKEILEIEDIVQYELEEKMRNDFDSLNWLIAMCW